MSASLFATPHRTLAALLAGTAMMATAATYAVAGEAPRAGAPFASEHGRDHPLAGTIWSTATKKPMDEAQLEEAIAGADLVLLGEQHDNPDHHRLQARLIGSLVAKGTKPAIVFEMLTADERDALGAFMARPDRKAADFGKALTWTERGWPDWKIYQPIMAEVLKDGLTVRVGDLGKAAQRAVGRQGLGALPKEFRTRSAVDTPLGEAREDGLLTLLEESHCRLVPKEGLRPMLGVQRARDAHLADALLAADAEAGSAVLVSGSGHARKDWAVPFYVHARAPEKTLVTVAFMEADDPARTDPMAYLPASTDGEPVFDYIWFTPRANIIDHCAELRARFPDGMKRKDTDEAKEKPGSANTPAGKTE